MEQNKNLQNDFTKEQKEIEEELNRIRKIIDSIELKGAKDFNLLEKYKNLRKRLIEITYKKLYLSNIVLASNELKLLRHDSLFDDEYYNEFITYQIISQKTDNWVGTILYRGYHFNRHLGDIGYNIFEEYRGKNFAYKSTIMLSELLNEYEIPDYWISTRTDNIPSIKTIEKLNGIIIGEENGIRLYKCQTKN